MDPETGEEDGMVEISGEVWEERDKSWCFYDGSVKVWLPKSRCKWNPDEKIMTIPEWIAIEDGLV